MKRPKKDKNLNRGISVTISQKSSDKVIGALVDIFSPVSQSLGLLGDRINTYRQQQEITALKMLREAKRIAKEKNVVLELPPPKFMLPYMDSASIEDGEDEEIRKKYANLLVSAGQQMDSFVYFARTLLSELAPDEAKLLDYLVETSGVLKFATARECNLAVEKNLDSARMEISTIVGRSRNAEMDREAALQAMIDAFSGKENAIFAGWSFNAKGTPFDGGDGMPVPLVQAQSAVM